MHASILGLLLLSSDVWWGGVKPPAYAEERESVVKKFTVDNRISLILYRRPTPLRLYVGAELFTPTWTKYWLKAEDSQTGRRWVPWATYEVANPNIVPPGYSPHGFTFQHADEPTLGGNSALAYIRSRGWICDFYSFDLLKPAEPAEKAFAWAMKPDPPPPGEGGTAIPTAKGPGGTRVISVGRLIESAHGKKAAEAFFETEPKRIHRIWSSNDRWHIQIATDEIEYTFARNADGKTWKLVDAN